MNNESEPRTLSQVDAFFVAFQDRRQVSMQLGADVVLRGSLSQRNLEQMLSTLVARWPCLGQHLRILASRVIWNGASDLAGMLRVGNDLAAVADWRNSFIDLFHEPPFQVLWIASGDVHHLSFRIHHAAADGEAFSRLINEALRSLATSRCGTTTARGPERALTLRHALARTGRLRLADRYEFVKYVLALRRIARNNPGVNVWKRDSGPGEIAVLSRDVDGVMLGQLREAAALHGTRVPWLVAAAWARTLYQWNVSHGDSHQSNVLLEIPVSLRRPSDRGTLGNLISPLVLASDALRPLEEIARSFQRQLSSGIRQRHHLAVPYLTRLGSWLPWWGFKRLSIRMDVSGFATSHFTWLTDDGEFIDDVARASHDSLRFSRIDFYTPVCLHMGIALAVLCLPERLTLCITYRTNALVRADVTTLAHHLVAMELGLIEPAFEGVL